MKANITQLYISFWRFDISNAGYPMNVKEILSVFSMVGESAVIFHTNNDKKTAVLLPFTSHFINKLDLISELFYVWVCACVWVRALVCVWLGRVGKGGVKALGNVVWTMPQQDIYLLIPDNYRASVFIKTSKYLS